MPEQQPSKKIKNRLSITDAFEHANYVTPTTARKQFNLIVQNYFDRKNLGLQNKVDTDKFLLDVEQKLLSKMIKIANFSDITADKLAALSLKPKEVNSVGGLSAEASKSLTREQLSFLLAAVKRTDLPLQLELGSRAGFDKHESILDNLQGLNSSSSFKSAKQMRDQLKSAEQVLGQLIKLEEKYQPMKLMYKDKKDGQLKSFTKQCNLAIKKINAKKKGDQKRHTRGPRM